ncbi:MAG TPA: hypothetical protein VL484_12685 [Vicinamibacterales bacterium]|jgi:hypothetical protein|nr:hypothetical protein [Vicinamibacterales bacterium]
MALLTVLVAGVLLLAYGLTTTFMANTETAIASANRAGREAVYAADAAAHAAIAELAPMSVWDPVLGGQLSAFHDVTMTPRVDGEANPLDLAARTATLQAETDAVASGPDRPVWRLFAWGPASMLLPSPASIGPFYLAVWFADDSGDGDGNPSADANGIVIVHAESYGAGGVLRAVECVISRSPTTGSRPLLLSWHELRPI